MDAYDIQTRTMVDSINSDAAEMLQKARNLRGWLAVIRGEESVKSFDAMQQAMVKHVARKQADELLQRI